MDSCFHCGLPVSGSQLKDSQARPVLEVEGKQQLFCCFGCQAVCRAIVDAGLDDYYRHRTDDAITADQSLSADFLKQLSLYDRPEIQKGFVRKQQNISEASLLLENIRCAACLWLNEKNLLSLPGVVDVYIDDVSQRARVRWETDVIRLSEILTAITAIGYIAHPYDASRYEQLQKLRRRRSTERLIFAGAIGMLVMNFSLANYFMAVPAEAGILPLWMTIGHWTSVVLVSLIMAYSGQEFFAGAWGDLRHRRLGMDIPVVLGLTFAFAGSLHTTITGFGEVYFDSIAMFVFFLLLARRYELGGKLRAANYLDRLSCITPKTALRINEHGKRQNIAVEELLPGDLIQLMPGETLAVDGTISRGSSSFDESLITGESHPVLRQHGDHVVAGAVNGEQPVVIRVTKTIQASTLSEIQQLVEHGLEQRPQYAQLAQNVAGGFIAAILVIAAVTVVYWLTVEPSNWLPSVIAVLIVTCPCALALATPVSLAVSAGRFMQIGVLPLRMQALDALATSDFFVFDKTGTLTVGQPVLSAVYPVGNFNQDQCLQYASALSADSEHSVAKALRRAVSDPGVVAGIIKNVPGCGVQGDIENKQWSLGKLDFTRQAFPRQSFSLTPEMLSTIAGCQESGQIVSLLSNSDGIQGVLMFDDALRPGVHEMLTGLKNTGVKKIAVLSGDSDNSVLNLCRQLGISDCHGGLSPQEKLHWIRSRQQQGHRIVMFGDGLNDAPALAAADVSVSFSGATDLANVSSDFLIPGDDPGVLVNARQLASQTRQNIMQNLVWAAAYNLIAVPFAAAGYIPPWGAAIGMSVSSMVVVLNALRLQSATTGFARKNRKMKQAQPAFV